MDIAKYIGLFLLKNNFCYLHGLGNLELKKKPASYDGDALHAPEYDVVLTPGGSIDDTLANFIATHEQTSISKAANALREFSTATRAELAAGKEIELPGIGKFTEQGGGVRFVANPHLQHVPPPVPMLRMSKRLEEAPDFRRDPIDASSADSGSIAWGRIALLGILAAAIIVGVIFGIRYFNASAPVPIVKDTAVVRPAIPPNVVTVPVDTVSIARPDTAYNMSVPVVSAGDGYQVVLNTYPTRNAANKRMATLNGNGNDVTLIARDSATYFVVMHIAATPADTTHMLDSLRRFFNPKGVHILQ